MSNTKAIRNGNLGNVAHKEVLDAINVGESREVQALANNDATITIAVTEQLTIAQISALELAITALQIDGGAALQPGARVIVDCQQDAAAGDNITFDSTSDTIVAPVLTGVVNDRDIITLIWTGSEWIATTAAWEKIVNAV